MADLRPLGLAPLEERTYRWLIQSGLSSMSEIARGVGEGLAQVRSAVATLEHRALVARASGRPARFSASPPEIALEALLVEREEALNRTRVEVRRLQDDYRGASQRRNPAELAEIVQGAEAVRQRVQQLWRSPSREVLTFDKPPYAMPAQENTSEGPLLAAGVVFKCLYSKESLEWPGAIDFIEQFVAAGEEARFLPRVPLKLNIFDRRVALLPLVEQEGTVEGTIIVHSSHLLDALTVLWETFWERAFPLPVPIGEQSAVVQEGGGFSADDARLASLLLAGSKAESIARQMNIALSTVERRIKRLMSRLGVETRLQAGYELARRGFDSDWA